MESAQEAASPQDQSQPATDPLAIGDSSDQQEPSSTGMESAPTTESQSSKEAEPAQPSDTSGLDNAEPQAIDTQPPVAQSPPVEPSSAEMVTVNTLDNVMKSPTQEPMVDPLAPCEPLPAVVEECQTTGPAKDPTPPEEEPLIPREDKPDPAPQETIGSVSSSDKEADLVQQKQTTEEDASVNAQPTSSDNQAESATDPPQQTNSSNEVPSSSNNSSSTSNSNSFTAGSSSSSGSNLGIRNAVTSDNSLKINGISDLSILDVTQGNDDEIEVKVEGGSLMHKVIKFSLLNGMQDSSKRLENSRLIMSGVGSNPTIEKTLASTSSLGRTALGGGPLRQSDKAKEEGFKGGGSSSFDSSKTTPPACSNVRPPSVGPSSSPSSSNSNSCDSGSNANNSDSSESKPNRTEEPSEQMAHSVDSSNVNSGTNVESVREESVSDTYSKSASLDFREWPPTSTGSTVPASTYSSPTAPAPTTTAVAVSTASSFDVSNANKETEQPTNTNNAAPVAKRPKAMYYAELPDFSKPIFSAPSLTSSTPSSTTTGRDRNNTAQPAKSLSQLQMKTPDFSRIIGPQSSSAGSPPTSTAPAASAPVSTTTSRSHELQIANPDFSKSFAPNQHPSMPTTSSASSSRPDERSNYINPTSFAEISKQRNYISDLQLKHPSFPEGPTSQPGVVKAPSSSLPPQGPSNLNSYRIEKPATASKPYPPSLYRQEPPAQVQLEEPKAHVIHKAAGNQETSKPWNPALEYSPKSYNQPNERERYPHPYPTGPKGPTPLPNEPPAQSYPGYSPYPPSSKSSKDQTPTSVPVTHPGGIIVNNIKTYYPEPHQPLPKSKDLEFRLEHKEKQLRQEGTIITLKTNDSRPATSNPPPAQNPQYPPQPYQASRSRSPATERRNETQEILYRDFKLKQSYEMPPQSSLRMPPSSRQQEESRPRVSQDHTTLPRDRSPYDPYYRGPQPVPQNPTASKYYPPLEHHKQSVSPAPSATPSPTPMHAQNRSPAPIPGKPLQHGLGSGMMHPPSNWPNQSRAIPSPHGSSTSSPSSAPPSISPNHFVQQKNSPSPVHSYGPQPGPSHAYKSPSPSSSSSPAPYTGQPSQSGAVTKYTQYYPCGNGERVVSIEINKDTYKPGHKELDYNMEQKFAEVCQAHEMKEKQAKAAVKITEPQRSQPYSSGSAEYSYRQAPYKQVDSRPQEAYRDEYGRPRAVPTSATHAQAPRYPPQENPNYGQYYQQRLGSDVEIRKSQDPPQPYKTSSSRDPSPAQRYGSNESLYHHHSKQPGYPPAHPSSSKAPPQHHPMYPSAGNEPPGPSSQYGSVAKSPYPSSPYERPPENPSVISNTYSQERGSSSRPSYPESRQHAPVDLYPAAGHPYQPAIPPAKSASSHPYPHLPGQAPPVPPTSRDNRGPSAWRYQQQQQQQQQPQIPPQQPGSSAYGHDRHNPPVRDERQNPVIQAPVNKNIPVKVIATVNAPPAVPSSTTIAPATSTTKRESPLDLSVKTVKTKADSTGCDDYGHSSRGRDALPKVNFNPNFKKHIPSIPERPPQDIRKPPQPVQPPQPYHPHMSREPQPIPQHHPQIHAAGPSSKPSPTMPPHPDHRQMPVIGSAIPPGYDKKTDAYMSANYRAVGGPAESIRDARYLPDNRYPPQQPRPDLPDQQAYRGPPPPGSSYPPRFPPGAPMPPHQYPNIPSKSEPFYPGGVKPPTSASSRSVYYPPHEVARSSKNSPGMPKLSMDDPRIEDRKFVESMLKKQASPSAEVIADLQAGKFSTRIPSTLAPAKKRPAEAIPKTSPPKAPRLEEPNLHRPYENSYRYPSQPGPAAPRDYYPAPVKLEPASPQPAGIYYAEKRSEMPSITRGVLNSPQSQPPSSMANHSVLQHNTQQSSHTSVITSYHAPSSRPEVPRVREESPNQRDYRQQPPYGQPDDRLFYPKPEPFRHGHGDPKYFGSSLDKTSPPSTNAAQSTNNNQHQQPPTVVMQTHIQYGGQKPPPLPPPSSSSSQSSIQNYKRPEVLQSSSRSDYYNLPNHAQPKPTIMENHHSRSYENLPRLISDPPKLSPEYRSTLPHQSSSQESLNKSSPAPSPQHRGADQSVISKLRTSLEQKERINQLRKQTSSEMSEEDAKPPEMSSFPPSHFRSKGAMKAYTPIPNFDMPNSAAPQSAQQPPPPPPAQTAGSPRPPSPIKSESVEIPKDPIEPAAEIEGTSALDILDWGSACNEFVEQLQTGKKRGRRKRGIAAKRDSDQLTGLADEGFRVDLPGVANSSLSEVPQEVLKNASLEIGEPDSTSDEDKPLHLLKQQYSSTGELKEEQLQVIQNLTKEKQSEKIARNMREKQRLEQEQKHEAKLGRCSSSEDEPDTKRLVQRSKMRARKLRNRLSVPLKSSDVNTDEEDEEEEEQDQARDLRKRKRLDQTTSESEAGSNAKRMNRCQTQVKQENGTELSSDEDESKSPGKKDASTPEVKKEAQQGARSDSESNDVKTKESVSDKKNCEADDVSSDNESEKDTKEVKKGESKKAVKTRTSSRSRAVEESSDSDESVVEEETMTRSKSKLELEKRRSNSKVLRNDKIVGNFVRERKKTENITPQKGKKMNAKLEASKKRILDSDSDSKIIGTRKRTRKTSKLQTTSGSESSEESDVETVSERLRSRKQKTSETSAPSSASKRGTSQDNRTPTKGATDKKSVKQEQKKRGRQKKTSQDCASANTSENFYPGWEKELYEFKRSLKVPPELITIGGKQYVHRISASLPDLDSHHSDESETFSEIVKKINQKDSSKSKKVKTKAASKQGQKSNQKSKEEQEEQKKVEGNKKFTSIIEILHERILRHAKQAKAKKSKNKDDKEVLKPKPELELLPTPGAESEALFNRKKKSLFDTAIFKSRTRTGQKVMQCREIIREVFGGDDERPQSAPPLACVQELKNLTYDEMYNEMLTKSSNVAEEMFRAQKKAEEERAVASGSGQCGSGSKVKIEDLDDETQDSVLLKDSERITEENDTPSVVSERDLATPVSFKGIGKKKTHKSRRKGSSGFDYIRKKKKPVVNNGENSTPVVPKKKVVSVFENLETKDESHISKEIRSWVLNKGVGESVMHRAARLGYTDVIVYCLERLEMDPDTKDNAGYTPLHEACAKGHLDICHYLLQYGASHSEPAPSGMRPLHEAVENSFIEVVRLLLAFGADPLLATYAGQTPIQLAENNEMELFLKNHLYDIQSTNPNKTGWKLDGPWKTHDPEESGCDILADIPGFFEDDNFHNTSSVTERSSLSNSTNSSDTLDSRQSSLNLPPPPPLASPVLPPPQVQQPIPKKCDSNSNIMNFEVKMEYKDCAVVLNDIHDRSEPKRNGNNNNDPLSTYVNGQLQSVEVKREPTETVIPNGGGEQTGLFMNSDSEDEDGDDGEFVFEYEEAERPLPPLYLLKDEAAGDKWVLMTDLCNILKLKSKEAVMRQICSNTPVSSTTPSSIGTPANTATANSTNVTAITATPNGTTNGSTANRELIRELKIEDFLSRASCLQLLYAGEKLNINSNKVVLVKYNENVRNLLAVKTLMTKI